MLKARTLKSLVIVFLFLPALAHPAPSSGNLEIAPQVAARIFAGLIEDHLAGVLRTARVIALTSEAQSGDWAKVKPIMDRFSQDLATDATCWYMLPDGSYYSTESGKLTDQNLSDRTYFPRLVSGGDVIGDMVISKSTGHRSVIVAAPVVKNGKVIAGIGVSLRARLLSELVESFSRLPEDTYFYALDANAKIALHRYVDRVFKKVSEVGNEQLEGEFKKQFAKNQGSFEYTLDKKRITASFEKSPALGWYFFFAQEQK